jgi:transcriptional regulator with XRE-family HTH domain
VTDWQLVSARIRERREALGWTQAQLAERVGTTSNYVAQVEGGLAVSEKKLATYATALNLTMPFLRYGAASDVDVEAVRAAAFAEGRQRALEELRAWTVRNAKSPAAGAGDEGIEEGAKQLTAAEIARAEEKSFSLDRERTAAKSARPGPRRKRADPNR